MGKLEKYTSYQDSNTQWLGKIPEHWKIFPFKSLLRRNGLIRGPFGSALQTSFFVDSGYKVYEQKNAIYDDMTIGQSYINKAKYNELKRFEVFSNDFLMSCSGTIGKLTKVPNSFEKGIINQAMLIIRTKNEQILDDFFEYLFSSEYILNTILDNSLGSAMKNLVGMPIFKNIKIPLPPKEEQIKIASFLDEKIAQIDSVISQKEKLIALLKEQKQITINEAVTKGLDKDVEFKDSGVEWIGEIPKHWEVVRSKRLFQQRKDRARKGDRQLTASQKYGVIFQDEFMELEGRKVTQVEHNYEILKRAEKGDFLISMRSFQGGIEYCRETGSVSSAYVALIPIKHVVPEYFKYLLKSQKYITALSSTSNLVRDGQALRFENFSMVDLLVIPKDEQVQIAEYIDNQTTKIDKAIELQQNYIAKLKEYKASLIDSVVTGKVRVA